MSKLEHMKYEHVIDDAHPIVDYVRQSHRPRMEATVCLLRLIHLLVVVLTLAYFL
jgi:hypothetical protein